MYKQKILATVVSSALMMISGAPQAIAPVLTILLLYLVAFPAVRYRNPILCYSRIPPGTRLPLPIAPIS